MHFMKNSDVLESLSLGALELAPRLKDSRKTVKVG
jgi:hypothetical protein